MIALNRKMPKTCFDCPCMATFAINKENVQNIQYLIRHCQAAKQDMDNTLTINDLLLVAE